MSAEHDQYHVLRFPNGSTTLEAVYDTDKKGFVFSRILPAHDSYPYHSIICFYPDDTREIYLGVYDVPELLGSVGVFSGLTPIFSAGYTSAGEIAYCTVPFVHTDTNSDLVAPGPKLLIDTTRHRAFIYEYLRDTDPPSESLPRKNIQKMIHAEFDAGMCTWRVRWEEKFWDIHMEASRVKVHLNIPEILDVSKSDLQSGSPDRIHFPTEDFCWEIQLRL